MAQLYAAVPRHRKRNDQWHRSVCPLGGSTQERTTLSERTKAGLQRAKRAGRKLGRRAVEVDLASVERLRAEGFGLRVIAERVGVSVNTLQKAPRKG
jgi:DNA invertase Pin-like site-specific DNA recombinase